MDLLENCSPNLFNKSSCHSVQFAASCCGAGAVLPLCRSSVPSRGRCSPAAGPGACSASSASASSRPQDVLRRATGASVQVIPKVNDNILDSKYSNTCKVGFHREIAGAFAVYRSVFHRQGPNCHVSRKFEAIPRRML